MAGMIGKFPGTGGVALAISLCAAGTWAQDIQIITEGKVLAYGLNRALPCQEIRNNTFITFATNDANLEFQGGTDRLDRECRWKGEGKLRRGTVGQLRIAATFLDFVQDSPKAPYSFSSDESRHSGINLNLFAKDRQAIELRSKANTLVGMGKYSEAVELFDSSYSYSPSPETLFLKADALEQRGEFDEATATWHRLLDQLPDNQAWHRASEVPERLADAAFKSVAETSAPSKWCGVADAAKAALDVTSAGDSTRGRIMGVWVDSLFFCANASGEYAKLADRIIADETFQKNWEDLYAKQFRQNEAFASTDRNDVVRQIEEIQNALGR